MKEKTLMTSFMVSAYADVGITAVGLTHGFPEWGYSKWLINDGMVFHAFALRVLAPAALIGIYALAKQVESKWAMPMEKSIEIFNIVCWSTVVINTINITGH